MENKELNLEELASVSGGVAKASRTPIGTITIGNIKHRVNIRTYMSGQAPADGYAYLGDVIKYYGKEGRWYIVKGKSGNKGYIHDTHVTIVARY